MANFEKQKNRAIAKRKLRSKRKLFGTSERPRMTVYKSLKHIYAQIVDDQSQKCIVGASTLSKELSDSKIPKTENAVKVGELIAVRAKEKGITDIVFDRSGYLYHGRVKAVAEGARKGGLNF